MNLDSLLSDDQRMIADSARRHAEKHGGPARLRTIRDRKEGYDSEGMNAAAEAGWPGLLVPESAGGAGLVPSSLGWALVLVQAVLRPGIHAGDRFDIEVRAEVDQRGVEHVAGDAGEAVEIQHRHGPIILPEGRGRPPASLSE